MIRGMDLARKTGRYKKSARIESRRAESPSRYTRLGGGKRGTPGKRSRNSEERGTKRVGKNAGTRGETMASIERSAGGKGSSMSGGDARTHFPVQARGGTGKKDQ